MVFRHRFEIYNLQFKSDGSMRRLSIDGPNTGDWFAVAFISWTDPNNDRIEQQGKHQFLFYPHTKKKPFFRFVESFMPNFQQLKHKSINPWTIFSVPARQPFHCKDVAFSHLITVPIRCVTFTHFAQYAGNVAFSTFGIAWVTSQPFFFYLSTKSIAFVATRFK